MGMTLQELDEELVARGFDAFQAEERYRYINWAYMSIAKESRWSWEKKTETVQFTPGEFREIVAPQWSSTFLVGVTSPAEFRKKLPCLTEEAFLDVWYMQDLANAGSRGEPESYFVWPENEATYLYLLPPPASARTITHVFSQKPILLTVQEPDTITPNHLDEAIVLASIVRCHQRANEPNHAQAARAMLEEQFDLTLNVEELLMDEETERVAPYPW